MSSYKNKDIVFFDGECAFCNKSVQLIFEKLKSRYKNDIYFAPLFGQTFNETVQDLDKMTTETIQGLDSFMFWQGNEMHVEAEAFFKLSQYFSKPLSFIQYFGFLPGCISNSIYRLIASNRHFLVSKEKTCALPSGALQKQLLD